MEQSDKQKIILEYLISSPDTFALCKNILKAEYFNPEFRSTVSLLHEYFEDFSKIPSVDLIAADTGMKYAKRQITNDEIDYCTKEVEKFCRKKAYKFAIEKASKLYQEGKEDDIEKIIKDAVMVSLNRDIGVNYYDNVSTRLNRMASTPQRISTGWEDVDEALGGGLARTELLLLSANSGGGKSISLANLGLNFCEQGLNVMYITLELSSDMVEQRFDIMNTGIPTINWIPRKDEIISAVQSIADGKGELIIRRMPSGTTSNQIRAFLKEHELRRNYVPDLLIIDYLDGMGANERVSADLIFEKDRLATEQLRDILFDYNMAGATASQQNRAALDAAELHQGHIAGGISKVNTADWCISIIFNNSMRAAGEMIYLFLKSRSSDAVGKQVLLSWDNSKLRISNHKNNKNIVLEEDHSSKPPSKHQSLLDIMDL